MTTSKEMILIGGIIETLNSMGSWTAETHVQKTAYITKYVRDVPLDAEFVLYKHGPYSFDLNKSLGHMLARNVLTAHSQIGYGPSLRLNNSLWSALDSALNSVFEQYKTNIVEVCGQLAKKNVAELERISTAVYVFRNFAGFARERQIAKLSELKPHIDASTARLAFEEAAPFLVD